MARRIQVEIVGDSRSVERAFKRAGGAATGFRRTIGTLGKVAAGGLAGGFVAAGLAIRAGFRELASAQKVAAQTSAVIRSTGGAANVTAKQVDKLSTRLSRMSGVDDEAIAAGQNMLMTFTNIRNGVRKNDKVFDMATATILDMSVALGRDLPDVAIMVGKALNDLEVNSKGTITGWSALRRVGVKVTSAMMDQAAAFIEAGKPMEAQKLLLQELQREFGGSARAFGTTMPGALGKLRNAFDELMAAFATGFLPLILKVANTLTTKLADPAFVERVRELGRLIGTKLYNAFVAISAWFQANWGGIKSGLQTAKTIAVGFRDALRSISTITPGGSSMMAAIISGLFVAKIATALGMVAALRLAMVALSNPITATIVVTVVLGAVAFKYGTSLREKVLEGLGLNAGPGSNESVTTQPKPNKKPAPTPTGPFYGGRHARGGPVMPGMSYMVGERGPEMFSPSAPGTIVPNGGGVSIGVVHVHGVQNVRQLLSEIQRHAKHGAAQSRGGHGGQRLALN